MRARTFVLADEVDDTPAVIALLNVFQRERRHLRPTEPAAIQRIVIEKVAEDKADEVRELAIRCRPHSLVAKQILEAIAPAALPTPEEEVAQLLEDLSSELIAKLEDLAGQVGTTELDENEAKELLWALAILWKDPPAGTCESVREFLHRRGLDDIVEEYVNLL